MTEIIIVGVIVAALAVIGILALCKGRKKTVDEEMIIKEP